MKRYFFVLAIVILVPFGIQAQNWEDALRYSNTMVQGTARAGAMGNAFGALGGDYTSAIINPAGLAVYRSSEFSFTPRFSTTSTEGTYYNSVTDDKDFKFMLNNISYVSTISSGNRNEAGIVSMSFGIGYNRIKDFNQYGIFQGSDVNGSYMDYFADNANTGNWSDYYEELAWKTDMLLYDENNKEYWHDIMDSGYGQSQRKTFSKNGSIDEYSFILGLNFNHKVYVGASLSILDLYYRESSTLTESDAQDNIPYFQEFSFNSRLITTGTGQNVKFGIIYKPVNELRLGVSLSTPTFYKVHDSFRTSMQSSLMYNDGPGYYDEKSPDNDYDYRIETPMRATFSGALVIGKAGLISADYELVNYATARLRRGGDGYEFINENMDIKEVFKTTGNLRVGGELRATDPLSLRVGYQFQPSAYRANAFGSAQPNADADVHVLSGGLGLRFGNFSFDASYRYMMGKYYDLPYPVPSNPYPAPKMAELNKNRQDVMFTLGFRF